MLVLLPSVRCSATVLKDGKEGEYEREGYGKRLYTNWQKVIFSTEGEVRCMSCPCSLSGRTSRMADTGDAACVAQDFDTVMKAIASNTERWGIFDIDLEFKRYMGEQQAS
jgi:hypothetical protein